MSYSGYLIRVGNYTIPHNLIKAESYSAYVNMQDIESWTDADGYLHREAVSLKPLKVEFETKEMLNNKEFSNFIKNIENNFSIKKARQCVVTAYIPEYDTYVTQTAYMADITPSIYGIMNGEIKYKSMRFAFIGGVYDG